MGRAGALRFLFLGVCLLALPPAPGASAHVRETPDDILKQIGVDEKLGAQVPADLSFRDEEGRAVRLSDYLGKGPVVMTLNYYTCPMLCPLTLRNLLSVASGLDGISLAKDFRIVTVSFDPDERPGAARERAGEMHASMKGIRDPGRRWPFLRGDPEAIGRLTAAVGFRYRKVGSEFAHPDVVIVLTPAGKVSRYLYGISPSPRDLRLALIEAADGRIGASSVLNQALLYCFHYDPVGRKYALYARNIMTAGGVFTLVILAVLYVVLWRRPRSSPLPGGPGDR